MLRASTLPLVAAHDLVVLDLDGVVYVGEEAVPGAPGHLQRVRESGLHVAYVTNNASRTPAAVAEKLTAIGVSAASRDVVTSAQAAAAVLHERHGTGAPVAVLGAAGLRRAVADVGLEPVAVDADRALGIVTGYGPDVAWREVMEAAMRIRDGLPWVATNTDLSLPTARGPAPGHGTLVDLLSRFAGAVPTVAGKPAPPLLRETVRRIGGQRPLMVGDRLDTDIEGACRVGIASLLVLTGVTGLAELVAAAPGQRPTYLSLDLGGLLEAHSAPVASASGWTLGGWIATVEDGRVVARGAGLPDDWWRTVAVAAWQHLDRSGRPADTDGLLPPGAGSGR